MKLLVKPYWKREDGWAATTTAIVMAVVAAAGAATSAVGSIAASQSKAAADKFNAQVSNNNAKLAQQQAAADAAKVRERGRRLYASQRAALSAAGVDPDLGSSIDVQYDSSVQNELDALTTLYKGKVSATNSETQAQLDMYSARATRTGGYVSAGGTLLGGIANSMSAYYSSSNNPSFNSRNRIPISAGDTGD